MWSVHIEEAKQSLTYRELLAVKINIAIVITNFAKEIVLWNN